jgi:hypothetical protein
VQVLSRSAVATAVAQEVLRLKTPAITIFRDALEAIVVGDIEVPKGTGIMLAAGLVRLLNSVASCCAHASAHGSSGTLHLLHAVASCCACCIDEFTCTALSHQHWMHVCHAWCGRTLC